MEGLQRELPQTANSKQTMLREELADGLICYELFREKNADGEGIYGIEIRSELPYDTGCISVRDITENEEYATELFERVIAYAVTPCELMYVAEDFIFEKLGA